MTKLEQTTRELVSLYVGGYISANALNDSLPDTWEFDEANDEAAVDLVMLVIGYLAEYQADLRSEDELRAALAEHGGWTIQRRVVTPQEEEDSEALVHVGAHTPLQVVLA